MHASWEARGWEGMRWDGTGVSTIVVKVAWTVAIVMG